MSMVFCRGCAKEIHSSALACPACGAPQAAAAPVTAAPAPTGIWYFEVLKKYAVFSGRARRKEYWMFFLVNILVAMVLGFIDRVAGTGAILSNLYSLALLIPGIAVGVRRMHDTDRSGWWLLLPIVNLIFLCQDSQPGPNRFGQNPKGIA
ncbi:DUF805 domain-containing protein [Pseudomonas donghuensis]|nr:uncharacterized membrane protein YhaH (DUF805 family) [Pseudomonas vranovensis]PJY95617.1 DUF805 domain-containing protein [Pseudomonas donghuensis]